MAFLKAEDRFTLDHIDVGFCPSCQEATLILDDEYPICPLCSSELECAELSSFEAPDLERIPCTEGRDT